MTTTDGDALLAAILASPAEDTPRLMYADWLDENANDERQQRRAELIRRQCEVAALERQGHGDACTAVARMLKRGMGPGGQMVPQCGKCTDHMHARCHADAILAAHGAEWARVPTRFGEWDGPNARPGTGDAMHGRNPQWSRGFVSSVECRLEEVGGRCEGCGGHGRYIDYPEGEQPTCSRCRGTGFVPAPWLAAVFRSHPLERVWISDREPLEILFSPRIHEWHKATWAASLAGEHDYIPDVIFAKMRGFTGTSASPNSLHVRYPTSEAARDALARAVADTVRTWVRKDGVT